MAERRGMEGRREGRTKGSAARHATAAASFLQLSEGPRFAPLLFGACGPSAPRPDSCCCQQPRRPCPPPLTAFHRRSPHLTASSSSASKSTTCSCCALRLSASSAASVSTCSCRACGAERESACSVSRQAAGDTAVPNGEHCCLAGVERALASHPEACWTDQADRQASPKRLPRTAHCGGSAGGRSGHFDAFLQFE